MKRPRMKAGTEMKRPRIKSTTSRMSFTTTVEAAATTTVPSTKSAAEVTAAKMTSTPATVSERHCAGRHPRHADRGGSSEGKNLTPHRSLSFLLAVVPNRTCTIPPESGGYRRPPPND